MSDLFEYYNIPLGLAVIMLIIWSIYEYFKQRALQDNISTLGHQLDLQNHVSEYKFDLEIKIYQELFDKMIDATDYSDFVLPTTDTEPKDPKMAQELRDDRANKFFNAFNAFTRVARKNSPFYEKEFYDDINAIIKIMKTLGDLYKEYYWSEYDMKIYAQNQMNKTQTYHNQIHDKVNNLANKVRDYLNELTKY